MQDAPVDQSVAAHFGSRSGAAQPGGRRRAATRGSKTLRPIARHGRLRRRPWATFGKVVASVAVVAVVSVLGIGGVAAANLVSDVKPTVHLVGEEKLGPIPDIGALEGGVNILLAATDTRTGRVTYRFLADRAAGTIIVAPEWRGEDTVVPSAVHVQFGADAPGAQHERPERPVINGVSLVGGLILTPAEYLTR